MSRWLVLLVLLVLAGSAAPAAAQQPPVREVVVVGVAGLRWDHVDPDRTPALAALAARGARGVLSVKAAGPLTCRADGWLTLGAGNRVRASQDDPGSCTAALPPPPALAGIAARAASSREAAEVGALADAVRATGSCVAADGRGAEVALGPAAGAGPGALLPACGLRLVDAGSSRDLAAADAAVRAADQARPGDSVLLVVGLSEAAGEGEPRLHLALAVGPGFPPGALVSASTRRAPYVQLVDVAPTALTLLGVDPPESMIGEPWRSVGEQPSIAELVDLDAKAGAQRAATVPFYVALVGGLLVLLGVAAARRSRRLAALAGLGTTAAVGASYLANLVPWWRADLPLVALLAVVVPVSLAAALGAARLRGTARPAGAVCGGVAAVLLADLLTGGHLQMSSVAGYSPLVAGRFAGIGNVAFGVLAASALLATAAATTGMRRRAVLVTCATAGLVVVAVDGAPQLGSDVGGVLALVPAFVLLALLRAGVRVTVWRLALAGLAGAAVVSLFALADWLRDPGERTHLGRFVQDVADGTAGSVLRRKAAAVLDLLFANPVTALLPLVVAAAVLLVARPPGPLRAAFAQAPEWRHGLLAVGTASAVGFAVNDSGAAVPALALLVAGPATVAVAARAAGASPAPGTGGRLAWGSVQRADGLL